MNVRGRKVETLSEAAVVGIVYGLMAVFLGPVSYTHLTLPTTPYV